MSDPYLWVECFLHIVVSVGGSTADCLCQGTSQEEFYEYMLATYPGNRIRITHITALTDTSWDMLREANIFSTVLIDGEVQ